MRVLRRAARRRRRDLGHGRAAPRLRLGDPPHARAAPGRGRAHPARSRMRRDRGASHPLAQHRGHRRRAREPDRVRAARLRRDHRPAVRQRSGASRQGHPAGADPLGPEEVEGQGVRARRRSRARAGRRPRTSAAPASPAASSCGRTSPMCCRRCRGSPPTSISTGGWWLRQAAPPRRPGGLDMTPRRRRPHPRRPVRLRRHALRLPRPRGGQPRVPARVHRLARPRDRRHRARRRLPAVAAQGVLRLPAASLLPSPRHVPATRCWSSRASSSSSRATIWSSATRRCSGRSRRATSACAPASGRRSTSSTAAAFTSAWCRTSIRTTSSICSTAPASASTSSRCSRARSRKSCKPDQGFFRLALDRAGCGPESALFVGDSLLQDIAGANQAGMRSVLIWSGDGEPPESEHEPSHVIRAIPEILDSARREALHRHQRLGLQGVEGALLPRDPQERRHARLLLRAAAGGRGQQHVLPHAGQGRARQVARAGGARLPLRAQGVEAHHAPEPAHRRRLARLPARERER